MRMWERCRTRCVAARAGDDRMRPTANDVTGRYGADRTMDMTFTAEHQAFREEVRAFIAENYTADMRAKSAKSMTGYLDKDDHVRWMKALSRQGWLYLATRLQRRGRIVRVGVVAASRLSIRHPTAGKQAQLRGRVPATSERGCATAPTHASR